jgi:hypothetical protein
MVAEGDVYAAAASLGVTGRKIMPLWAVCPPTTETSGWLLLLPQMDERPMHLR